MGYTDSKVGEKMIGRVQLGEKMYKCWFVQTGEPSPQNGWKRIRGSEFGEPVEFNLNSAEYKKMQREVGGRYSLCSSGDDSDYCSTESKQ